MPNCLPALAGQGHHFAALNRPDLHQAFIGQGLYHRGQFVGQAEGGGLQLNGKGRTVALGQDVQHLAPQPLLLLDPGLDFSISWAC